MAISGMPPSVVGFSEGTSDMNSVTPRANQDTPQFPERALRSQASGQLIWPWVRTYASILGRMNTHVPPILMFTRGTGF